jgi:hypothetical protein
MYTLVSAIGKRKAVGSRWVSVDISDITLNEIYRDYQEVYAVLSNTFYTGNRTLLLSSIKNNAMSTEMTLPEYLTSIGNTTLPVITQLYKIETKWVGYNDAFKAHYKIRPTPSNGHVDSTIPLSERDWLSITRPNTDYNLFFKSCLISVNGLFHRTDTDGERVYIIDGMKSCRKAGENQMGITSFMKLGELEFLPMTQQMIHRRYSDEPLKQRVYIDIGTAKPGKYPMLVLGGYLYLLDQRSFFQVSDTIYGFNIRNIPWRERFFESRELIDLSSLELEEILHNDNQVVESELYSDSNITKMFTLSQSFLVFIDNPDLFIEYDTLRRSSLANIYTSYTQPKYPLTLGYGRLGDYWSVKEDGQWSVTVQDNIKWNYIFNTVPEGDLISYDNGVTSWDPFEKSRCQFMRIGSDFLTVI